MRKVSDTCALVYRMGFVANIKSKNCVLDEEEIAIPALVTALLNEEYDVHHVTLRNGKREINLKKRRKGVSVRFSDSSPERNPRETFRQTMDILEKG